MKKLRTAEEVLRAVEARLLGSDLSRGSCSCLKGCIEVFWSVYWYMAGSKDIPSERPLFSLDLLSRER